MNHFYTKGFAVPETLVYVAVFALISAALVNALLLGGTAVKNLRATRESTRSIEASFDRIAREVRSSKGVSVASSTLGSHPGKLSLLNAGEVTLATTTLFLKPSGSATTTALLTSGVEVTQFIVRRMVASSSEAVRIEATIDGEQYTLTVVARGSYY